MRVVAWFLLLALIPVCLAADNNRSDLKALYDAHRWFDLRDSVAKGSAPVFYQGAVACAFNDLRACEKKLAKVIKSEPQSESATEAHRLLAAAYFRLGRYHEALTHVDAILSVHPGDSDVKNDHPLLAALRDYADQTVMRRASTTVELQDAGLPIEINGVHGTYWFDTGADVSALSESDAKRFNLLVLNAPIKEGDITGAEVDSRVAVADELSIGSVRLSHVAFLVFSDNQPPFNELPPGSRGVIGFPVLLALQRFVWQRDKKFEIDPKSLPRSLGRANVCFDGHGAVVLLQFEGHNLALALDTGATNTDLYPPFAELFPELIRTASKTQSYKMEGVGGDKYMNAAILESLRMSIGAFPVTLRTANVLLTHTTKDSHYVQGNLGIDLLQQAHRTTFDFNAMTLTLQ
jgi:tetratricopeptide (TPR) repeat protein